MGGRRGPELHTATSGGGDDPAPRRRQTTRREARLRLSVDPDSLLVTSTDEAFLEASGHAAADLVGCRLPDLCQPRSRGVLETALRGLRAGGGRLRSLELLLATRGGGSLPVLCNATLVEADGVRPRRLEVWCRDISPLRRVAGVAAVLDVLPNSAVLVDAGGLIAAVNATAERMFGYPRRELVGQPVELLLPPAQREAHRIDRARFLAQPATRPMGAGRDLRARRRNGSEIPVQIGLSTVDTAEGPLALAIVVDITDRRRAESALRATDERLRLALHASHMGVWQWEAATERLDWSAECLPILGVTTAPARFEELLCHMLPDDAARVERVFDEAMATRTPFATEFRFVLPDGSVRWIAQVGRGEYGADGTVVRAIGTIQDVTTRQQDAEALRESEGRFRALVDASAQIVWTALPDGRTAEDSPSWRAFTGQTVEQYRGLGWIEAIHPEDRAPSLQVLREALADRRPAATEYRLRRHDGAWRWTAVRAVPLAAADGEVRLWVGMNTDVTERRRAEEALRASQLQLVAALDAAGMGTWLWDIQRDRVTWDQALQRAFGLAAADATDHTLAGVLRHIHAADRERIAGEIAALLEHGSDLSGEYRVPQPDGSERWMSFRGRLQRDAQGRPQQLVGVNIDVTDRKHAAEALLRSQKLEALGTLAGGIAHDFNNLLLAIGGNCELALGDLPADHPARDSLAEIARASSRAGDLVGRILAFSRPSDGGRVVLDLAPIVTEALRLMRASLPTLIAIETEFAPDLPPVAADAAQIHQIVVNLTTNAAHAIGRRAGAIAVGLDLVRDAAELQQAAPPLAAGACVRLTVRDDGCGMDERTRARIFDPYFTTKPAGQGTGLGLSVVHGILQAHGAAIAVDSAPGTGTTFRLYFPTAEHAARAAMPATAAPPAPGAGERVLYVDDEEPLVLLVRRALHRLGYRVTGCTDAAAALALFRAAPGDFDAVVTDLTMPGMSGLDLAAAVRAVRADVPIVLTSGYLREEDEDAARAIGVCALIAKPNTIQELGHALHQLLQGRTSAT